jgi:hypothetical protein
MTDPESVGEVAAQRIVHADIAEVYNAIARVERWSAWMSPVVAPVTQVGPQSYELSSSRDGTTSSHRAVVRARGPVHSFVAELDARWVLDFRCTPHGRDTSVRATAERISKLTWRERLSRRRRTEASSARLSALLDQLAAHLENPDG